MSGDESMALHSIFKHTPLQDPSTQIRLLWMHSATTFSISTWDRKRAPAYYAISYTWGPPDPAGEVLVDGKPFIVRPNCQYALEQVHAYVGSVYVWIDSICMDQTDNDEKSAQVAIMGPIYHDATGVLACIGPADDASTYVCSAVNLLKGMKPSHPAEANFQLFRHLEGHSSQNFKHFLQRTYFKRLWVLQEACAGGDATVFLCGSAAISKSDLLSSVGLLLKTSLRHDTFEEYEALQGFYKRYSLSASNKLKDPYGLHTFLALECQDPRDRVYGTLMLFNWNSGLHAPLTPDYCIKPADLCLYLAKTLEGRDLSLLWILVGLLDITVSSPCPENMASWYWPNGTPYHDTTPAHRDNIAASFVERPWRGFVSGGCRLITDAYGRLQAPLDRDAVWHLSTEPVMSEAAICERISHKGRFIYTDSVLSGFTNTPALPGDILLVCPFIICILRPTSHNRRFIYIGRAVLTNHHKPHPTRERRNCGCAEKFEISPQMDVLFEASDKEAMALLVTTAEAKKHGLQRLATTCWPLDAWPVLLNTKIPRVGSIVRDVTETEGRFLLTSKRGCCDLHRRDWKRLINSRLLSELDRRCQYDS